MPGVRFVLGLGRRHLEVIPLHRRGSAVNEAGRPERDVDEERDVQREEIEHPKVDFGRGEVPGVAFGELDASVG